MSTETNQAQDASQEPSIEEILASIRKIISEDDPPEGDATPEPVANDLPAPPVVDAPRQTQALQTQQTEEVDVLELTDFLEEEPLQLTEAEPESSAPEPQKPAEEPKKMNTEPPAKSWEAPSAVEALVSPRSESSATEAMARLARSAQQTQRPQRDVTSMSVSTRSLDEIVEDMLRPMLSEWLDGNLPLLVEKLVERELNRMARRAEDR